MLWEVKTVLTVCDYVMMVLVVGSTTLPELGESLSCIVIKKTCYHTFTYMFAMYGAILKIVSLAQSVQ